MSPGTDDPGGVPPPVAVQTAQPGLIAGLCAIFAGLAGFGVPILASLAGIWLGVSGFRRGRAAGYKSSQACGLIGVAVSVLSAAYWVSAVLFGSYH